jgi:8-oxo-dGTP pyrophosphatase MutT (NUDIX family)
MTPISQYAGGFLFNSEDRSVLIHLRDHNTKFAPGKWSFFGGLCEQNETPAQGFIRELKEELTINISEESIVPLRSYFNEKLQTQRNVFYAKSALSESEMTLTEGAGFEWVPIDKVLEYDLADKAREDLEFFIKEKL